MVPFKFFRGIYNKINWQSTGLLDGAMNIPLLTGVLDITHKYIIDNNLLENETSSMLLPIMTRLYGNKNHSYSDYDITFKINEVINHFNSREMIGYVRDIQTNAWTGVDIEAEICAIVTERCNWEEDDGL